MLVLSVIQTYTQCVGKIQFPNVKSDGMYNYHTALKCVAVWHKILS